MIESYDLFDNELTLLSHFLVIARFLIENMASLRLLHYMNDQQAQAIPNAIH